MIARLFSRRNIRPKSVPPGRRIYAIGDIHGRLDLLDQLLGMIEQDQRDRAAIMPEILLLGDLIDRSPESAGVVRRAMTPPPWARMTTLMGNHEASMIGALDGDAEMMRMWLRVGGWESLLSWGVPAAILDGGTCDEIAMAANAAIPDRELAWIRELPQCLHIGDYFFVHAGVRPGVALARQTTHDSYWIRDEFLGSRRDHGAIVVHGHSISPEVEEMDNRIGIDTGAYMSGKLSALALEGEQRWLLQT
jgi:serine/threonine protein phosphatase 1